MAVPLSFAPEGAGLSVLSVITLVLLTSSMTLGAKGGYEDEFYYGQFPKGFMWGVSSAAYQMEGAWNLDGKGPSIWDVFSHHPGNIVDNETADVTCDTYHKYKEDIALAKKLGVSHYRFSLSWPRLIPDPLNGTVNPAGVAFYNRFLDTLEAAGIQPIVTMYHWDLPQTLLTEFQGWINPKVADYYLTYADFCFRTFGKRVKWWLTFNEPLSFIQDGLGTNMKAPGWGQPAYYPYMASKTMLLSHARAYHLYDAKYRATQNGHLGVCFATKWMEPKDKSNPADVSAADRAQQFTTGWFAHPIYGAGDYPPVMKEGVARKSREQGLLKSRLPEFTAEEVAYIKGTYDYFGINYYTARLVEYKDRGVSDPGIYGDSDSVQSVDPKWPKSPLNWLYVVPWGFRKMVNWVTSQYGRVPILVTENGYADGTGQLDDDYRIDFYKSYIDELLKASNLDNCSIIGYSTWSILDNFEWDTGYMVKFGLHYVNFSDPNRPRTPKKSAGYFTQVVKNNGFPKP